MSRHATTGIGRHGGRLVASAAVLGLCTLLTLSVRGTQHAPAAVIDPADLSLTKSDSPDPVAAGRSLTYTIFVANVGPDPATGTVVTDDLPSQVSFEAATTSIPAGSCKRSGRRVTCELGTLAASSSPATTPTVTIKVTVKNNVKVAQISNTASVASDVTDPNPANNSDTELTRVVKPGSVSCRNRAATIVGTGGNDVLIGTARVDVIVAFAGNDTIIAAGGRDIICAGRGADSVSSGSDADFVKAGAGPDLVRGRGGADVLRGNRGRDRLRGNRGPDLLAGGFGFDRCRGGRGHDILRSCER